MENVARIVRTQKLTDARTILHNAGYGLTQTVLDASFCGVPQARKRFFLIGCLGEKDGFLDETISTKIAAKPMSVADYFGDELEVKFYYRHPRSYKRRGVFSVEEPSPTIRGVNRPVPVGYTLHPGDPIDSMEGIRALTTEERSRIQTFPKNFKFLGNKTDREQMIGNAVPVNLGRFIGECISAYLAVNFKSRPTFIYKYYKVGHITGDDKSLFYHPTNMTRQIVCVSSEPEAIYHKHRKGNNNV